MGLRNRQSSLSNSAKLDVISVTETECLFLGPIMVSDNSNKTVNHYLHSGNPDLIYLQELKNALIADINNLKVPELNTASACVLHKE